MNPKTPAMASALRPSLGWVAGIGLRLSEFVIAEK